eukprot:COSAG06_NODE_53120_length_302_cov_0.344828_1_plen_59_part_10
MGGVPGPLKKHNQNHPPFFVVVAVMAFMSSPRLSFQCHGEGGQLEKKKGGGGGGGGGAR